MRTTKKSVLIETTHMIHGCLEQGGVSGRVVAYPIDRARELIGVDPAMVDDDYEVAGYDHVTAREMIERNIEGRVIRKGHVIQ